MTEREYEKFTELMLKFLRRYTENQMIIEGIDIWYQQQVLVDASLGSSANRTDAVPAAKKKPRVLLEQEKLDQILQFKKNQKAQDIPQTSAMQVTLILRISFSTLPQDLLAKMAMVTIQEKELELIMMLQEQSAFYTYFKPLDGITSDVVLELTPPPTAEPTTYPFYLANQVEDIVFEEDSSLGFGIVVGLAVGFLWCLLTGCSVAYLMKARATMKEQRDLENLLKHDASGPAGGDTVGSSSSSIPMGNDDEKSLTTEAELSILEKRKFSLMNSETDILTPKLQEHDFIEMPSKTFSNSLRNSRKSSKSPRNSFRSLKRRETSLSSLKNSRTSQSDKRKAAIDRNAFSKSARSVTTPQEDMGSIRQVHSQGDLADVRGSLIRKSGEKARGITRSSSKRSSLKSSLRRSSTREMKSSARMASTSLEDNGNEYNLT
jgi:hypothetical protein